MTFSFAFQYLPSSQNLHFAISDESLKLLVHASLNLPSYQLDLSFSYLESILISFYSVIDQDESSVNIILNLLSEIIQQFKRDIEEYIGDR
jgi:hypothetical protein